MTLHKKFSSITFPIHCQVYNFFSESSDAVVFEADKISFVCSCDEQVLAFYRLPEREEKRVGIDKSLIGQTVSVNRVVAWVGYAKNPGTVCISHQELRDEMNRLWKKETGKEDFEGINWRLENGLRQWANYEIRKRAYGSKPVLRDRGFWFQDREATAIIQDIAACYTGDQVPPTYPDGYDDYWPGYLSSPVYHQLYCATTDQHQRVLIHPLDIPLMKLQTTFDCRNASIRRSE